MKYSEEERPPFSDYGPMTFFLFNGVLGNYRQVTARSKLAARFMHVEGLIA